ncbi:MAG: PP2C family protein-serine/threonine phosphatase [Planctomycetota bacterium]|nr:PP2C family protein-serine/threonine phosphatase [Planctomycetota bacterium]
MTVAAQLPLDMKAIHAIVQGEDAALASQVAQKLGQLADFVTSTPGAADLGAGAWSGAGSRAVLIFVGVPRTREQLAMCEDARSANLPVVAIADAGGLPDGVLATGADARPESVAGFLRGLVARQATIDDLSDQVARATRQDAPLKTEMTRLQDELVLAASVQREFLPRTLPRVGDWQVGALWRPASYVSGDIYNAFRADEHHLAVFVLDAVGHGVPAALLTLVLARAMPIKRIEPGSYRLYSPAESLDLLNREMVAHTGRNARFATAAYALIDLRTGLTRVATAGHPPVFRVGVDGALDPIPSSGPILGILEEAEFEPCEVTIGPGEGLLLYTDGFEHLYPQAHPTIPGALLPTDRYLELFAEAVKAGDAASVVASVDSEIDRAKGPLPLIDDVTMVVAKRGSLAPGARE